MNANVTAGAACLLLAASGLSCRGPDDELAWDVGETRQVISSPRNLPTLDGTTEDYQVFVPLGLQRFRMTLGAQESLRIGKGVQILAFGLPPPTQPYGFVSSMGSTLVESGADIGSIYSYGNTPLRIAAGATVHGYVKSRVPIETSPRARIEVGVQDNVDGIVEWFRWKIGDFSRNQGNRTARANPKPMDLTPGAYSTIEIEAGATVRLTHGQYQIDDLNLLKGGHLETNNTLGPVYVWIRSSLVLAGSMFSYTRQPNVLFGYSGSTAPVIKTEFSGTLVAPAATLSIPATPSPHRGAFYAKAIEVADRAVIEQNGFWLHHEGPVDADQVCAFCANATRQAIGYCCESRQHTISRIQLAEAECRIRSSGVRRDANIERSVPCSLGSAQAAVNLDTACTDCLRHAMDSYSECVGSQRFFPDTCAKLGYPDYGSASCS